MRTGSQADAIKSRKSSISFEVRCGNCLGRRNTSSYSKKTGVETIGRRLELGRDLRIRCEAPADERNAEKSTHVSKTTRMVVSWVIPFSCQVCHVALRDLNAYEENSRRVMAGSRRQNVLPIDSDRRTSDPCIPLHNAGIPECSNERDSVALGNERKNHGGFDSRHSHHALVWPEPRFQFPPTAVGPSGELIRSLTDRGRRSPTEHFLPSHRHLPPVRCSCREADRVP